MTMSKCECQLVTCQKVVSPDICLPQKCSFIDKANLKLIAQINLKGRRTKENGNNHQVLFILLKQKRFNIKFFIKYNTVSLNIK